ncbi:MAG: PaaI family thioesterase [Phototrophicaceae bacterium]
MSDEPRFTGSNFVGGNWINGFGVSFSLEGDAYVAHYTFKPHQQGPHNIAHGGAVAALLDEAMTATVFKSGLGPAFTVNLNVSYRAPIYIGEQISIFGKIRSIDGRKIFLHTEIYLPNDTLATEAEGLFIRLEDDL